MISWQCSQQSLYQAQEVLVCQCGLSKVRGSQTQVGAVWWVHVMWPGPEGTQREEEVEGVAGGLPGHQVPDIHQCGRDWKTVIMSKFYNVYLLNICFNLVIRTVDESWKPSSILSGDTDDKIFLGQIGIKIVSCHNIQVDRESDENKVIMQLIVI